MIVIYINIVPKENIKDTGLFSRINNHIANYSWSKCLKYPHKEDRSRYCELVFVSSYEIDACKEHFCPSCCNKYVDVTNVAHNRLCVKQCDIIREGSNTKEWKQCVEPDHPEKSIYPYCDDYFANDFYQRSRCKIDMCNLCCVSMDVKDEQKLSDTATSSCYEKCLKSNF